MVISSAVGQYRAVRGAADGHAGDVFYAACQYQLCVLAARPDSGQNCSVAISAGTPFSGYSPVGEGKRDCSGADAAIAGSVVVSMYRP